MAALASPIKDGGTSEMLLLSLHWDIPFITFVGVELLYVTAPLTAIVIAKRITNTLNPDLFFSKTVRIPSVWLYLFMKITSKYAIYLTNPLL